ncbi:hypothetical protein H5410_053018 [Solanum commersonii]|uniref:Uncharacterized protein n=1 Tax=Solanum commersonii TaxID=4109 RepID=A0A9J5X3S8_SOLCO|nr:hypothetical protein H5410_053018 [Solanum commersonii]
MQGAEKNTKKEITADSSGILGDVAMLNMGELEAQVPIGEVMIGREEKEVCNIEDQRTSTSIKECEVQEAELLCTQQQLLITEKEKEVSAWVKQNLQLLLQVDRGRHQEVVAVCKKTRFKGSNELKSLVAFDVKFQSGGVEIRGETS